jgi:hypothetical protein
MGIIIQVNVKIEFMQAKTLETVADTKYLGENPVEKVSLV